MSTDLRQRIEAFLSSHHTMTLATVGDDASPWATTVFYVNYGLDLWWLSSPCVRHSIDIAGHPRVAVAINEDCADRPSVRGVQMQGRAEAMGAPAREPDVLARYAAKFPSLGDPARPSAALERMLTSWRVYRFVPARAVAIDYTKEVGWREALDLLAHAAAAGVTC